MRRDIPRNYPEQIRKARRFAERILTHGGLDLEHCDESTNAAIDWLAVSMAPNTRKVLKAVDGDHYDAAADMAEAYYVLGVAVGQMLGPGTFAKGGAE